MVNNSGGAPGNRSGRDGQLSSDQEFYAGYKDLPVVKRTWFWVLSGVVILISGIIIGLAISTFFLNNPQIKRISKIKKPENRIVVASLEARNARLRRMIDGIEGDLTRNNCSVIKDRPIDGPSGVLRRNTPLRPVKPVAPRSVAPKKPGKVAELPPAGKSVPGQPAVPGTPVKPGVPAKPVTPGDRATPGKPGQSTGPQTGTPPTPGQTPGKKIVQKDGAKPGQPQKPGAGEPEKKGQPPADPSGKNKPKNGQVKPTKPQKPGVPKNTMAKRNLNQLIDDATVLVTAMETRTSGSTGTGFFINSTTVVTNSHVIEKASRSIVISNRKLNRRIRVTLLDSSKQRLLGGDDFAILKLAEPVEGIVPFTFTDSVFKSQDVIAAGYPGFELHIQQKVSRGKIPGSTFTKGSVRLVERYEGRHPAIMHDADIHKGNSGGPLVDYCGRVVGINTFFIRAKTKVEDYQLDYALAAKGMMELLERNGVRFQTSSGECS